jgi:hypothetical protein
MLAGMALRSTACEPRLFTASADGGDGAEHRCRLDQGEVRAHRRASRHRNRFGLRRAANEASPNLVPAGREGERVRAVRANRGAARRRERTDRCALQRFTCRSGDSPRHHPGLRQPHGAASNGSSAAAVRNGRRRDISWSSWAGGDRRIRLPYHNEGDRASSRCRGVRTAPTRAYWAAPVA